MAKAVCELGASADHANSCYYDGKSSVSNKAEQVCWQRPERLGSSKRQSDPKNFRIHIR